MQHLLNTAIAHHQAGRLKEAESGYRQVLAVDPDSSAVHSNMGLLMQSQERLDDAVASFHDALRANTSSPLIYRNLGLLLLKKGETRAAKRAILAAVDLTPLRPEHHLLRRELSTDILIGFNDPVKACEIAINKYDYTAIPPLRIRIETSSICNLRCQHCPTGISRTGNRAIMEMDLFEKILSQIKTIPTLREAFFYLGGEPLLNKNLPAMCRLIKENSRVTHTQFTTNAMLLNEETSRKLAEADINKIIISIDGKSPEENNRIRKGADYHLIRQNVAAFIKFNQSTQIEIANTIVKRREDPDAPETPDFLLQDFEGIPVVTRYAMKWPQLSVGQSEIDHLCLDVLEPEAFCPMPFNQIAVKQNGDVVPCCYDLLGETVMGNIQHDELAHIWNNTAYRHLRRTMMENESGRLPKACQKCSIFTGEMVITK